MLNTDLIFTNAIFFAGVQELWTLHKWHVPLAACVEACLYGPLEWIIERIAQDSYMLGQL